MCQIGQCTQFLSTLAIPDCYPDMVGNFGKYIASDSIGGRQRQTSVFHVIRGRGSHFVMESVIRLCER